MRRGLEIVRSISQNIQTKPVPRPTTTPRNSKVKAGAVSMSNISVTKQTAYQQIETAVSV